MDKLDSFILSRFFYRIGASNYGMTDRDYDLLAKELESVPAAKPYLERSYDDDPVPYSTLIKYYSTQEVNEMTRYLPDRESTLNTPTQTQDYVSKSIKASFDIRECYSWIEAHKDAEMCVSLKVDGINTLTTYRNVSRLKDDDGTETDKSSNPQPVVDRFAALNNMFDSLEESLGDSTQETSEFSQSEDSEEIVNLEDQIKEALLEARGEIMINNGTNLESLQLNEVVNQPVYEPHEQQTDGDYNVMIHSRSRGRRNDPLTFTTNTQKCLPRILPRIQEDTEDIHISAEAYVEPDYLETIGYYARCSFTTSRDAARSALQRTDYPDKIYNHVKLVAFRVDLGDTLSEGLDTLREQGFPTVPYKTYKFKYTNYAEFEKELSDLIWEFKAIATEEHIPNDGIVLQVNKYEEFGKEATEKLYDDGNLAVKALGWEPRIYSSIVKEIQMKRDYTIRFSCKAIVEPVYTENQKKLTNVNLFNPARLIENDIHEGDLIEFEYKNDTTINFRRKLMSAQQVEESKREVSKGGITNE